MNLRECLPLIALLAIGFCQPSLASAQEIILTAPAATFAWEKPSTELSTPAVEYTQFSMPVSAVERYALPNEQINAPESERAILPSDGTDFVVAPGQWIDAAGSAQVNASFPRKTSKPGPLWRFGSEFLSPRFGRDKGIGHERVMYAPLVIDTAVGMSNVALRLRSDRGLATPDRLETIWATLGRGPAAESRVDVLDSVLRMELGNAKAMAISEYTLRSLNPERNDNTVGFGDMVVGGKALMLDGRCTKIASIFRTYLKTGPSDRGLGTGHVSLEPGILMRHQWHEHAILHGEVKYWLPIAGTTSVAGDVLKTGIGISTIWRESDSHAILPTFECVTYSFLAGSATGSDGVQRRVNGDTAVELYPGLRIVMAPSSDLGLIEIGTAIGMTMADRDWFDTRTIFELRMIR